MKVTVERAGGGPMKFEDFANANGLEIVVRERPGSIGTMAQFYAKFRGVEVMEPGVLVSAYGNGATPEAAINDYKNELLGKYIAINAYRDDRRNVQCPTEWL